MTGREGYRRKTQKASRYAVIRELWAERERLAMDRYQLSDKIGYHHMMIGRWERGEATPSVQRLHDWCDALGLTLVVIKKADLTYAQRNRFAS